MAQDDEANLPRRASRAFGTKGLSSDFLKDEDRQDWDRLLETQRQKTERDEAEQERMRPKRIEDERRLLIRQYSPHPRPHFAHEQKQPQLSKDKLEEIERQAPLNIAAKEKYARETLARSQEREQGEFLRERLGSRGRDRGREQDREA